MEDWKWTLRLPHAQFSLGSKMPEDSSWRSVTLSLSEILVMQSYFYLLHIYTYTYTYSYEIYRYRYMYIIVGGVIRRESHAQAAQLNSLYQLVLLIWTHTRSSCATARRVPLFYLSFSIGLTTRGLSLSLYLFFSILILIHWSLTRLFFCGYFFERGRTCPSPAYSRAHDPRKPDASHINGVTLAITTSLLSPPFKCHYARTLYATYYYLLHYCIDLY